MELFGPELAQAYQDNPVARLDILRDFEVVKRY
jgi:hypothetical protein